MKQIWCIVLFFISLHGMDETGAENLMKTFSAALDKQPVDLNAAVNIAGPYGIVIGRLATPQQLVKFKKQLTREDLALDQKLSKWNCLWYGKPLAVLLGLAGTGTVLVGSYKFVNRGEILFAQEDESTPFFKAGGGLLAAAGTTWAANPYRYKEERRKVIRALMLQLDAIEERGGEFSGSVAPSAPLDPPVYKE